MKKLTDQEWDRLFDLLRGIREEKTIQWFDSGVSDDADTWLDDDHFKLDEILNNPLRYRVKPETVTIYLYESAGEITARTDKLINPPYPWRFMYSFEHEVQQ